MGALGGHVVADDKLAVACAAMDKAGSAVREHVRADGVNQARASVVIVGGGRGPVRGRLTGGPMTDGVATEISGDPTSMPTMAVRDRRRGGHPVGSLAGGEVWSGVSRGVGGGA